MRYYESAFPVYASTNGVAYEIYLAGCKGYCEGCHSPHTWNPNLGTKIDDEFMKSLIDSIKKYYDKSEIDNICILGGEPLDNSDDELSWFVSELENNFPKCKLYVYTHFAIDYVKKEFSKTYQLIDYVKCGKYDQSLRSDQGFRDKLTGVYLISSNQHFYKGGRKYDEAI